MRSNAGLLFVIALVGSVLLHELFHLAAARASGMRVSQYFVGFGPTLFSSRIGETQVGLKLLPLGGFVRIVGMDESDAPQKPLLEDLPDYSATQDWWEGLERGMRDRGVGRLRSRRIRDAARSLTPSHPEASAAEVSSALTRAVEQEMGASRKVGDLPHRILRGDAGRLYRQRPHRSRAAAILAGPLSHLLVAFLLLTAMQMLWPPRTGPATTEVGVVAAGSPASAAGMQVGDRIVSVGETSSEDFEPLRESIRNSPGVQVPFVVERDGRLLELLITPEPVQEDEGLVGVAGFVALAKAEPVTLPEALANAWSSNDPERYPGGVLQLTQLSVEGLAGILSPSGLVDVVQQAAGMQPRDPEGALSLVGAVSVASQVTSSPQGGWQAFVLLLVAVNVFLMVFNLVPLPPFDGGHLASTAVESVVDGVRRLRGSYAGPYRVSERVLGRIAVPVYGALLVLLTATLWLDIFSPITL